MIVIRSIAAHEWSMLRDIRLRALQDAPMAFGSTYAREAAWTDEEWTQRLLKWSSARQSTTLLAFDDSACCGIVGCTRYHGSPDEAMIVSMWVAPEARRRGIGLQLLRAAEDWAREQGLKRLALEVNQTNALAIALYLRFGFTFTGETSPYPNAPNTLELWMERPISTGNLP